MVDGLQTTQGRRIMTTMKIELGQPGKSTEIQGPKRVRDMLRELDLMPEAYLVIREGELVTEDDVLQDRDTVEIRPVISGGAYALP